MTSNLTPLDQLKRLLGVDTYREIVPAVEKLVSANETKKQRASDVLKAVIGAYGYEDKKPRYWLDDKWVRWARIDKDIQDIIDGRELEPVEWEK